MAEIKFLISEQVVNSMTWEEYESFERAQEGNIKLKDLRPVLARFMVNGDGITALPHKDAMKILGSLPMSKIKETMEQFTNVLKVGTIPNGNGSSLQSHTEVEQVGSPSLDG